MDAPRNSSELNVPLNFYSRSEGVDASNAPAPVWTVVEFRLYAKELVGGGSELNEADQDGSVSGAVFWVRFRNGISNTMRLTRAGQWFEVVAVDPVGRMQWIRLTCKRVNGGDGVN